MIPVRTIEEREQDMIARGRGHIINERLRKMWQEEIDEYGCIKQENVVIN